MDRRTRGYGDGRTEGRVVTGTDGRGDMGLIKGYRDGQTDAKIRGRTDITGTDGCRDRQMDMGMWG